MKETSHVAPKVPEELMARFRSTAMERLEKVSCPEHRGSISFVVVRPEVVHARLEKRN